MIDLMGKRKIFFMISIFLVLAGVVGLFINGLELDIQFQGGTVLQIEMPDNNFDTLEIESRISNLLGKTATAQKLSMFNPESEDKEINMLMLKVTRDNVLSGDEMNKVITMLRDEYGVSTSAPMNNTNITPAIGEEMLRNSLLAILIASSLIVLYVWWRFSIMSGFAAAMMAIVALLHDAGIMLAVYTVIGIPINEAFIAATLTILGYSLNDTIIIYDRIRENSKQMSKSNVEQMVNRSVNQTLSRSINTTVTVLFCIITVYILSSINNVQTLKDFSLPLIIGLASGAYSSIFIATPLWMMWKQSQIKKRIKPRRA